MSITILEVIEENLKDPEYAKHFYDLDRDLRFQLCSMVEMFRASSGLTQKQFAEKIGTKQPAIARIENMVSIPSLQFLQKIAVAFNVPLIFPSFGGHPLYNSSNILTALRSSSAPKDSVERAPPARTSTKKKTGKKSKPVA